MERFPERSWNPADPRTAEWLGSAEISDGARIPYASNYVFLLELRHPDAADAGYAVYKPAKGENPLWDFPANLYRREVAAYRVSEALGWSLIPPTVERADGLEYGVGSLQAYVPTDYRRTYFELRDQYAAVMRRFALFDWVANNADRKGGHVLLGDQDSLWGIDNGLCFHVEEKLRTVIWDYAGETIPPQQLADVGRLASELENSGPLRSGLAELLHEDEISILAVRARRALEQGRLPEPPAGRRSYPWPLV